MDKAPISSHWRRDIYSVRDMASWVARPRFGGVGKDGNIEKKGWYQVVCHPIGWEKAQWKSGSRGEGSSWSGTGNHGVEEGHQGSNNSADSISRNSAGRGGASSICRTGARGHDLAEESIGPRTSSTQLKWSRITERSGPRKNIQASKLAINPITLTEDDLYDIGEMIRNATTEALQEFITE